VAKILLINGPNLDRLGKREPDVYGNRNLEDIVAQCQEFAETCGHELQHVQNNAEHELVGAIHQAGDTGVDYIVINPAAFTHTSVALRDALLAVDIPFIEVHLSNISAREAFRQHSYFSDIAMGIVSGFGAESYLLALQAIVNKAEP
jgi:3-dehydroquinate dehydratase-2